MIYIEVHIEDESPTPMFIFLAVIAWITSAFILSDVLTNGGYDSFTTSLLPMERSSGDLLNPKR